MAHPQDDHAAVPRPRLPCHAGGVGANTWTVQSNQPTSQLFYIFNKIIAIDNNLSQSIHICLLYYTSFWEQIIGFFMQNN